MCRSLTLAGPWPPSDQPTFKLRRPRAIRRRRGAQLSVTIRRYWDERRATNPLPTYVQDWVAQGLAWILQTAVFLVLALGLLLMIAQTARWNAGF